MSFYSYKNANADTSPGQITGNAMDGICERICIQVKNVYDSCLQQEQLNNKEVTVSTSCPCCQHQLRPQEANRSCPLRCSGNQVQLPLPPPRRDYLSGRAGKCRDRRVSPAALRHLDV